MAPQETSETDAPSDGLPPVSRELEMLNDELRVLNAEKLKLEAEVNNEEATMKLKQSEIKSMQNETETMHQMVSLKAFILWKSIADWKIECYKVTFAPIR